MTTLKIELFGFGSSEDETQVSNLCPEATEGVGAVMIALPPDPSCSSSEPEDATMLCAVQTDFSEAVQTVVVALTETQ